MTAEFRECLEAYLHAVERAFERRPSEAAEPIVSQAEEAYEFSTLHERVESDYAIGKQISGHTRYLLGRFFRNSGLYLAASRQESLDVSSWCARLDQDLRRKTETITYFAPLEMFDSDSDEIKCGDASIRRLSDKELIGMLNNGNNRLFYPAAYIDIAQIRDYYFLVVIEEKRLALWNSSKLRLTFKGDIAPAYSGFPRNIESAL